MDKVLRWLDEQDGQLREELFSLLSIPSVSADPGHAGQVRRCAEWLASRLHDCGFEATAEETGGHPAVLAAWRGAPGKPTVLVYGHYDVQPPEPLENWTSPPFEPVIRDGNVVARGASDDKGQLYCHIAAVAAHMTAHKSLPVNLVFLIEGEEESGSANLERFVEANREPLACDAVVISDSSQFAPGVPAITYGLRGLIYLQVTVRGPARDLHSGSFGGAVANPANVLARILAALHDENGRVNVPGFYDDVRPLAVWERQAFGSLPFDETAYRSELGVDALSGEAGYSVLERVWARPTLDVNGIWSGYTGEGAKTVLPAVASAKLSCRLVPDQDPARIAELVENRVRGLVPASCRVQITRLHDARPVLLPVDAPATRAAAEAVRHGFGADPVFIREGGSIPVVEAFQRLLETSVVLLGFGRPDDGAHGPDEKLNLEDFRRGAVTSAWLWKLLGEGSTS